MYRLMLLVMVCCCLSITLLAGKPALAAPAARFVQDRFAVGFWVLPEFDSTTADERYAEIAAANFSMVISLWGAPPKEQLSEQIALCKKYDLKLVTRTYDMPPEQLPEADVLWGYYLTDEPNTADFPALARQVEQIRTARPGRLAYINLFPNYATAGQLLAPTYDEYIARFLKEVPVDVLCMDHYPLFTPTTDGRDAYCENLEVMRKFSLAAGIPFWNFFNTMPFYQHTDPTEDQLRWQIFTSLAYGAKGVLYFCYFTPGVDPFAKGGAIINLDGTRTRHWYQAQRLNARLKQLGPTLMQLTSTGVYRIKADDDPAVVLKGTPIKTISRGGMDPPNDYLIGVFTHRDGRQAVLIDNYRFAYTAWPTIEFTVPVEQITEVDGLTGRETPVHDDSPRMPGLQVSLDAGEGRLFLIPAQSAE